MTDYINTGGPAEPGSHTYMDGYPSSWEGKTVLDHFAGLAMQGQLAGMWTGELSHRWSPENIAKEAYSIASAMVAEKERIESHNAELLRKEVYENPF